MVCFLRFLAYFDFLLTCTGMTDASPCYHVHSVRVPSLYLNSIDDPFGPQDGIPVHAYEHDYCV